MDSSLPGSSVHGIFSTRILVWVAFSSPGDPLKQGMDPVSPALQADSLLLSHWEYLDNLWTNSDTLGEGYGNPFQCSCLENPRTGEPGGLPSMGSHRVRHDWSNLAAAAAPASLTIHESHSFLPQKNAYLCFRGGEGNGTPLQYSCLENPMDGGAC